jgi:hypothetical protein
VCERDRKLNRARYYQQQWSQCVLALSSLISACAQCVIFDEMFYVGPPALVAKRDAFMLLELHSLCETTNWNTNNYYWHHGDIGTGGSIISKTAYFLLHSLLNLIQG